MTDSIGPHTAYAVRKQCPTEPIKFMFHFWHTYFWPLNSLWRKLNWKFTILAFIHDSKCVRCNAVKLATKLLFGINSLCTLENSCIGIAVIKLLNIVFGCHVTPHHIATLTYSKSLDVGIYPCSVGRNFWPAAHSDRNGKTRWNYFAAFGALIIYLWSV